MEGIARTGEPYPYEGRSTTPIEPIPFSLYKRDAASSDTGTSRSGIPSQPPSAAQDAAVAGEWDTSGAGSGTYDKLCKGDVGYGGSAFASSLQGRQVAEGLLALKLRGLGVGRGEDGGKGAGAGFEGL